MIHEFRWPRRRGYRPNAPFPTMPGKNLLHRPMCTFDVSIRYIGTMLDLAILGLLEESDRHGYEIRREVADRLGLLANISFGSLYPALARLERAGAVEVLAPEEMVSSPSTGSLSGERAALRALRTRPVRALRGKKAYRITESGKRHFIEMLTDQAPEDSRSFHLKLSFARHLTPAARIRLLDRRRGLLEDRLGELDKTASSPIDRYEVAVTEHTKAMLAADLTWLETLLASERDLKISATSTANSSAAAS